MKGVSRDTQACLDGICDLLNECHPLATRLSADYLKWLYIDNPLGVTKSANYLRDGKVLASYAVKPMAYRFRGRVLRAAHSINTATHPSARGQRLFPRLAPIVYEDARNDGFDFVVGVANAHSIGGFRKFLGFEHLGHARLVLARLGTHLAAFEKWGLVKESSDPWLQWRLRNPSASYSVVRCRSHHLIIAQRRIPVVVGATTTNDSGASINRALSVGRIAPCYMFAPTDYGLAIPRRIIPSPWHVIIKNLRMTSSEFEELKRSLVFTGLDSDTF